MTAFGVLIGMAYTHLRVMGWVGVLQCLDLALVVRLGAISRIRGAFVFENGSSSRGCLWYVL